MKFRLLGLGSSRGEQRPGSSAHVRVAGKTVPVRRETEESELCGVKGLPPAVNEVGRNGK